jgi:hypothetical protein
LGALLASVSVSGAAGAAQIAHGPAEIPARWTALAPEGTCLANPWSAGCPAPSSVAYPSQATLVRELRARFVARYGSPAVTVSARDQAAGALTARTARSRPVQGVAAQDILACTLTVFTPGIIHTQGNHLVHGTSTVSCPGGYAYAEVSSSLYRSGVFIATDTSGDIIPPLFAAATASYDCDHDTARPYANTGLGFVQHLDGSAATNTRTATANHTCPT